MAGEEQACLIYTNTQAALDWKIYNYTHIIFYWLWPEGAWPNTDQSASSKGGDETNNMKKR